jgi:hypothetical protein
MVQLTADQMTTLGALMATADNPDLSPSDTLNAVKSYYNYLSSLGDRYAALAGQAIDVTTLNGCVGYNYLTSFTGAAVPASQWSQLARSLMDSDYSAMQKNDGASPTSRQIAQFHIDDYGFAGLDPSDWIMYEPVQDLGPGVLDTLMSYGPVAVVGLMDLYANPALPGAPTNSQMTAAAWVMRAVGSFARCELSGPGTLGLNNDLTGTVPAGADAGRAVQTTISVANQALYGVGEATTTDVLFALGENDAITVNQAGNATIVLGSDGAGRWLCERPCPPAGSRRGQSRAGGVRRGQRPRNAALERLSELRCVAIRGRPRCVHGNR